MEADSTQAATALLTEHLQYTPLSLIDDIIDSVNNFIYQGVGSLETGLLSTPPERLGFKGAKHDADTAAPDQSVAKREIEEGLHKLETLLNSTVDKNFDKFEIYVLRNILSVPVDLAAWIRLSHYEGISHPLPAEVPSSQDVQILRQKLAASRAVNRTLSSELSRNAAIIQQLQSLVGTNKQHPSPTNLSFLRDTVSQQTFSGQHPLATNTSFALSQLPTLKTTLLDLKSKLESLRRTQDGTNTAKDDMREERWQYIESRTRQHLERHGQLSAAHASSVAGKQTNKAEIESLEKLANMFDTP